MVYAVKGAKVRQANRNTVDWCCFGAYISKLAAIKMTDEEKSTYRQVHLRHRLTLLRTLRERSRSGYIYNEQGDIYRCVKDGNLMAVRLLMDFLGIKGQIKNGNYSLISPTNLHQNDVRIDKFIGRLLLPSDIQTCDARILAGVYVRADKELAHLTTVFNDEFNEESILIEAATIVENLLKKHLYDVFGESLPEIDR